MNHASSIFIRGYEFHCNRAQETILDAHNESFKKILIKVYLGRKNVVYKIALHLFYNKNANTDFKII